MSVSSAELHNPSLEDAVYKCSVKPFSQNKSHQDKPILATKFKCLKNFATDDIETIRKLLAIEREKHNDEEYEFMTSDFDRMMEDDWLVSRFLMRGLKVSEKQLNRFKKPDLYDNTIELIKSCAKFRFDYRINGHTRIEEFPIEWTSRDGIITDKPDRLGNPTIYLKVKLHKPRLIETKELRHQFKRLLLFMLEKCDRELKNKPGKGICCIFDMSEATFDNVDLELISWMIKSFKNCSPKLLSYAIVYNLPWFFSATFKLISNTLMSNSNKNSLRFVYGREILSYIDHNNVPPYIRTRI